MAFDAFEFVASWCAEASETPKRRNRNKSGRTNRRQYNGRQTLQAVGGRVSSVSAIYGGNDKADPDNPRNVLMCEIAERDIKAVTTFSNPEYVLEGEYKYIGRPGAV